MSEQPEKQIEEQPEPKTSTTFAEQLDDDQQEPLIPPQILLFVGLGGFVVALLVLFTQPSFGVVGFGGVGIGILSLVAWAFMAPDQAGAFIGQRNVRFGGFTIVVSVLVIIALIAIYTFIRGQEIRYDLTERNTFSLTDEAKAVMTTLGADPSTPSVKIVAFYSQRSGGRIDQDTLLFEDYEETTNGKVTFEFIDPDRNPELSARYGIARDGQLAVIALDENGDPDFDRLRAVDFFAQDTLTNAILSVSASGNFRAYVLEVENGMLLEQSAEQPSIATLIQGMTDTFNWTIEPLALSSLLSAESEVDLTDANFDGTALVIAGGSNPLTSDELSILQDYINDGGDLVIFAANSFINEDLVALATSDGMGDFLAENFGLRVNNDVVFDQVQAFQSPQFPVASDLDPISSITGSVQTPLVFDLPHSIAVLDEAPTDVTVTILARSSDNAYAKTDLEAFMTDDDAVQPADDDARGPFVLGAQAENAATGARLVIFGSTAIPDDALVPLSNSFSNFEVAYGSLIWATAFDEVLVANTIISAQEPADAPIAVPQQDMRYIGFLTTIILPFGVLAIGIVTWWMNRERARAA